MGVAAMLGAPIKRREDPRLITGQATYVDDIKLLWDAPYGGVAQPLWSCTHQQHQYRRGTATIPASWPSITAEDLKGKVGNIAIAVPLGHITEGMGRRGPLADGKVRFYGDPVAVVIADDRYTARDALDLIDVDYEPLPAAIDH